MELETFIRSTFNDIIQGVLKAQDDVKETGAIINAFDDVNLRNINFDIATTVEKTIEGEGKGSAKVVVAGISLGGSVAKSDSVVSRISFTIPVVLPNPTKVEKGKKPARIKSL